jgi:hypothetical protein
MTAIEILTALLQAQVASGRGLCPEAMLHARALAECLSNHGAALAATVAARDAAEARLAIAGASKPRKACHAPKASAEGWRTPAAALSAWVAAAGPHAVALKGWKKTIADRFELPGFAAEHAERIAGTRALADREAAHFTRVATAERGMEVCEGFALGAAMESATWRVPTSAERTEAARVSREMEEACRALDEEEARTRPEREESHRRHREIVHAQRAEEEARNAAAERARAEREAKAA